MYIVCTYKIYCELRDEEILVVCILGNVDVAFAFLFNSMAGSYNEILQHSLFLG